MVGLGLAGLVLAMVLTAQRTEPVAAEITASDPAVSSETTGCPEPVDPPEPTTTTYAAPPAADVEGPVRVLLQTSCGDIELTLDPALAPTLVASFVGLAEEGYYAGVPFHRVVDGFMIQGGDPTGTGTGCLDAECRERLPGFELPDELDGAREVVAAAGGYPRGTVALANAGPDTNGSQFFVVQSEEPYPLPPAYAVLGTVTDGMEIVDRIAAGSTANELALDPVVITSVEVAP